MPSPSQQGCIYEATQMHYHLGQALKELEHWSSNEAA